MKRYGASMFDLAKRLRHGRSIERGGMNSVVGMD